MCMHEVARPCETELVLLIESCLFCFCFLCMCEEGECLEFNDF